MDRVRVDRWLWAARFFKTRSTAADAVLGGRVHVNSARVKPSKEARPGDRLEVTVGAVRRELVVRGVAEKRSPASVAATLYEETPESAARRSSWPSSAGWRGLGRTSAPGRRSATSGASTRCGLSYAAADPAGRHAGSRGLTRIDVLRYIDRHRYDVDHPANRSRSRRLLCAARRRRLSDDEAAATAALFRALGDPARVRIVISSRQ